MKHLIIVIKQTDDGGHRTHLEENKEIVYFNYRSMFEQENNTRHKT